MSGHDAFERILASLHDAMLDDVHWPTTTALIDEACGLTSNALQVGEGPKDDLRVLFVGLYCRGQRRENLERKYLEVYRPIDERVPRLPQVPDPWAQAARCPVPAKGRRQVVNNMGPCPYRFRYSSQMPSIVRRHGIPRCPGRGTSAYAVNEESPSPIGPGPAAAVIGTAAVTTVLPEITPETLAEWQRVVDLTARLARVPASLIMQTERPKHLGIVLRFEFSWRDVLDRSRQPPHVKPIHRDQRREVHGLTRAPRPCVE